MRYSKTALKELSAQYYSVLKKCLLLNLSLLVFTAANATELIISSGEETIDQERIYNEVNLNGTGSLKITADIELQADAFTMEDNSKFSAQNGGGVFAQNVTISGGTIDLSNGWLQATDTFIQNGGTINLSNESDISAAEGQGSHLIDLTAGTLNVLKDENFIIGSQINIGNTVNISENVTLSAFSDISDETSKTNINLKENALVNLSGKLNADVIGQGGTININHSSANVMGNIDGVNLTNNVQYELKSSVSSLGLITANDHLTVHLSPEKELDFSTEFEEYYNGENINIKKITLSEGKTLDIQSNWLGVGLENEQNKKIVYDGTGIFVSDNLDLGKDSILNLNKTNLILAKEAVFSNNIINLDKSNLSSEEQKVIFANSDVSLKGQSQIYGDHKTITLDNSSINMADSSMLDAEDILIDNDSTMALNHSMVWADKLTLLSGKIELENQATLEGIKDIILSDKTFISLKNSSMLGRIQMNGAKVVLDNSTIGNYFESEWNGDETTPSVYNLDLLDYVLDSGTLTVKGKSRLAGSSFTIDGILNIEKDAELTTATKGTANEEIEEHFVSYEWEDGKSLINLNKNGIINLSGTLNGNLIGEGTLNINHSNAAVNGDITIQKDGLLNLKNNKLTTNKLSIQDNGTVAFQVSGKNEYGSVMAQTYDISQVGTNLNLTLDMGILNKDESAIFTIFADKDGNAANVDFANLSKNERYDFIKNEDGTYTITGKASASDVVEKIDPENGTVESVISGWIGENANPMPEVSKAKEVQEKLNELSQTNPEALVEAVKSLMPETAPVTLALSNSLNNKISGIVGQRLSSPRFKMGQRVSSPRLKMGQHPSSSKRHGRSGGDELTNMSVWAQALYNKSKLDTNDGFNGKTKGVAMGADAQINQNVKIGFGYAFSQSDVDATTRQTDVDTHTAIVYGQYTIGRAFVDVVASYGRSMYEENRRGGGIITSADYDMDAIYTQIMSGYNIPAKVAVITPEIGARYLWTKTHSYTDSAEQTVDSEKSDTLTGVAGIRISAKTKLIGLKNVLFSPEASIHATYDIVEANNNSFVNLVNGSSYSVEGNSLERLGVEASAKLGMSIKDVELSLEYNGRFKTDYTDHTGTINFKYNF